MPTARHIVIDSNHLLLGVDLAHGGEPGRPGSDGASPYPELRSACSAPPAISAPYEHRCKNWLRNPDEVIAAVAVDEQRELMRRERAYRDDLPPPEVAGKTVIIVDDGIATGSTMLAAVAALRKLKVGRIVVAVPTVAPTTYYEMESAADEVVAVVVPSYFRGVGEWY